MKQPTNYKYECLNDARDILAAIGMPDRLKNARCVMAFCACAEITGQNWKKCSEDYRGTHTIISFINTNFPNKAGLDSQGYQENSREDLRKHTLKPWVDAAIMEQKPGIATNDRNNAYRFTSEFAALVRKYGTDEWDDTLQSFISTHGEYKEKLKQIKDIPKGFPVDYHGIHIEFGGGPHNKLQKAILEDFVPYHAPGAELLYVGDTSDRYLCLQKDRLKELGVNIFDDSKDLPDIILYDKANDRIIFIEAFSSTGEFSLMRIKKISSMCNFPEGRTISFVTAFLTESKMMSVFPNIAWDTDIWVI